VDTIKQAVGRPRPNDSLEGVRSLDLAHVNPRFLAVMQPLRVSYSEARIGSQGGNSFPSGHAANNCAVAAVSMVFFRRWGWLVFLPASLVAYSRIYVGSHWPLDVLVSCLIGAGVGVLTAAAMEAIWRRWAGKWVPNLRENHPSLLTA
jgi:undecaprenyl-diphosphatase